MKEYGVAGTQIEEAIRLYRAPATEADPLDLARALRVSALNDERRALEAWAEAASLFTAADLSDEAAECQCHIALHTSGEPR